MKSKQGEDIKKSIETLKWMEQVPRTLKQINKITVR
jgi:hypothetical protein